MSLRSSRISQDFAALKKMLKKGSIVQLKPFDPKKKSIDHLAVTIKGPKGTPYQGGLYRLEIRFPPEYPRRTFGQNPLSIQGKEISVFH
jgi:ubiquitin-conjugating enzyme (huntingtin interacting protein 2)